MAQLTKEQQSKIGRKSRRKGKCFERELARYFTSWFGAKWETTRNSGRTDLPGDIYCPTRPIQVCVEAKHRKTWTLSAIARNNTAYRKELDKVIREWEKDHSEAYPVLWVFCKNADGLWVAAFGAEHSHSLTWNGDPRDVFHWDMMLVERDGAAWIRVTGVRELKRSKNVLVYRSAA